MIKANNADKIGEFSLTDKRFSRITKFMGETLYDENAGGPNGNFHIALGSSYHDAFDGDMARINPKNIGKISVSTIRRFTLNCGFHNAANRYGDLERRKRKNHLQKQ